MGFEYKNKRGNIYHLHQRGKLFYFSKDSKDSIDMPDGYAVVENSITGLPMLRKK